MAENSFSIVYNYQCYLFPNVEVCSRDLSILFEYLKYFKIVGKINGKEKQSQKQPGPFIQM